ncbi:MAG: competence/damage-inducible protein A [Saprospiraceae bacterium]|nr:competence/damage-inducible protein A [Saprospiraceae bacterium]
MRAAIVTVGDEILLGQIVDTNSAWIADRLSMEGILIVRKTSVGDVEDDICSAIQQSFKVAELVIMTGGLGPTKDDITKKALAKFFECDMVFSEDTFTRLSDLFLKRNIPITAAHKEQCFMPDRAELIINNRGTAPGMWFEFGDRMLCSMPGVPHEMRYIMENGVVPRVKDLNRIIFRQKTIRTSGTGESVLAEIIEPILEGHPVKVAYLPAQGQVRLRLSVEGAKGSEVRIDQILQEAVRATVGVLGTHVYGYDHELLEEHVGNLLKSKGLTLGTAESCTGGHISHLITSIPGASAYFRGTIVAYDNGIKEKILGVKSITLESHGAVSIQTVREMVEGAIRVIGCDVAIAVSGIAGPEGGSDTKPVGTVCIAVGDKSDIKTRQFLFVKDRLLNIKYASMYALDMLRKFLSAR